MPSALGCAVADRHRLPHVGKSNVDAVLAAAAGEPIHAVLFFTGDTVRQIAPGTPIAELPEDWRRPTCDAAQAKFMRIGDAG